MRVLLTGGSGMLGQAIQRLAPKNWSLVAPTKQELNLTNQAAVQHYLQHNPVDLILHTAAKVGGIKANMADQAGFYAQNALINLNLIEEARKAGIKNVITFGSSCMYPRNHPHLLTEDDILTAPLEPTNEGYALAKINAAKHGHYISQQYGLNYKMLIPCNLYGPGDHYDPIQSHLIPATILKIHTAIKNNHNNVEIWGDGTARREFIYVDDLAHFITTQSQNIQSWPNLMNIGAGHDLSINEVYQHCAQALNYKGTFTHDLNAPKGMHSKLMSSSKAAALGWKPKHTIKTGLAKTYKAFCRTL